MHLTFNARCTFLLGIDLGVELLGFKLFLCSVLIDTARQFAKVFVSIYTPTATGESSSCSISLPALGGVCLFIQQCVFVCARAG